MPKPKIEKCGDCRWCVRCSDDRYECHLWPPVAAPAYDAPHLWEFPKVDPENHAVCSAAE